MWEAFAASDKKRGARMPRPFQIGKDRVRA
jgi:hypothetical protein